MNAASYLGVQDWRLPTVSPVNGTSFDYSFSYNGSTDRGYNVSEQGTIHVGSTANELAHLFYNTLNNKGYCDPLLSTVGSCSGPQPGWGLSNAGPFSNLQPWQYWFGTEYGANTTNAWNFLFNDGDQFNDPKGIYNYFSWAVRSGDIGVVPVPAAAWLFGSALAGLGWMRRRSSKRF